MFLLDTGVVLALRQARSPEGDARIAGWAASVPRDQLFLSSASLIDLARAAPRRGADAVRLRAWVDGQLVPAFKDRLLAIDADVARRVADSGVADLRAAVLAATALAHGLTLATLEPAAFRGARLRTYDPRRFDPEAAGDGDWRAAGRSAAPWIRNFFVRGQL